MRPKIVKLIDRYNLKVNELRSMNEKFVRARSTFDAMMEQSLAKYNPSAQRDDYTNARPEYGYAAPQSGYQATSPQQQLAQHPHQQQQPYLQPSPGEVPGGMQQQQEYAQAWAAWYAQQGYQQQQPPPSGQPGAPPHHAQSSSQQAHAASSVPPSVNDPAYAQWYYAQQQQQQQQPPPQQGSGASSTASPGQSGYDYQPAQASDPASLHDQDKRALFERARAEAEAYHRAHQQHGRAEEQQLQ